MDIKKIDLLFNRFDLLHHQIAVLQGLSDSTFRILRAIFLLGEGCTQTNIYQYICVNKQTTNSAIKQLLSKGYIRFESGRGRENKIYLTVPGKELIETKIKPIEDIEKSVFCKLNKNDIDVFVKVANEYLFLLSEEIKDKLNIGDNV